MIWKQQARERLEQYDAFLNAYYNIPVEIKRLEAEAQAPGRTRMDRTGSKGNGRNEDKLLDNIVFRRELQWSWERTKQWLDVTNNALACLEPGEQMILKRLCIRQEKDAVEQLSRALGTEKSTVYRLRDRAMKKFILALYGAGDNQLVS